MWLVWNDLKPVWGFDAGRVGMADKCKAMSFILDYYPSSIILAFWYLKTTKYQMQSAFYFVVQASFRSAQALQRVLHNKLRQNLSLHRRCMLNFVLL